MKWNSKNKKHYQDLGYEYTKMRDSFLVRPSDLMDGSAETVKVVCDNCGCEKEMQWQVYIKLSRRNKGRYYCKDCAYGNVEFIKDRMMEKYGVTNALHRPEVLEKIKETCKKKYGCENPFQSELVKEKIRETNIQKYGFPSSMQNPNTVKKGKETCLKKYGFPSYMQTQEGRERVSGPNSPVWKGGPTPGRERATKEYKDWRKSIYLRDDYTCQCCGDRSCTGHHVELHAHHKYNWEDYKEKRYDITNGITLCDKCHYEFHSMYGKHNNNPEQIDKFIELKRYAGLAGN